MHLTRPRLLSFLILSALAGPVLAGDEFLFVDNGTIRIGVDLESGGSIFHFSEVEAPRNLLNHFDRGRFIQQSFYGDEDGSVWAGNPWRWNPVQGGDYLGNPATLLDHSATTSTITTRTIPRNWAGGETISDCLMEADISLHGPVVHIQYRFVYTGTESHAPRHQEMPAVFVDYDLPHLVFHDGGDPWTGGELRTVVPGWPNEYHRSTGEWSAFTDDSGWGIGVYMPGTQRLTCYRFRGPAGPEGSGCSYVAPIRTLAVEPGLDLRYDVYLTIGTVEEIRERFGEIRRSGRP